MSGECLQCGLHALECECLWDDLCEELSKDHVVNNEWISVKDGLPGQFDHILVCDGSSVVSGFYQDESFVGLSIEVGKITHWMPLPKPPENI